MLPRERVIEVINHRKPDRIPIYGWLFANMEKQISERFGSVRNFEDIYEFDMAHIFGGPTPYINEQIKLLRKETGGMIEPAHLTEVQMNDTDNLADYESIKNAINYYKGEKGRFVYVQTPGIFECLNSVFGIENHLCWLALYEKDLHRVYKRQAEWNLRFANNCLDLGADMVHVSDDWGGQNCLLFKPETWWRLIYPYHRYICEGVKKRGAYVSLHSDGNISSVLDGVVELGYNVVHPWQESAGMSLELFKKRYINHFTVMGGLDIQTTLGFGKIDFLRDEIRRVMNMFRDGGLIFCTSHFVQEHCSIEELVFAFDTLKEER